jgi:GMP synthase-like glutamine amidotransferase
MGAYDDETLPWLRQEKQLIAEAVRADVPYWGVCLGSQLLAASLGSSTSRCPCRWRPSGPPCPPTRAASRRWKAR